MQDIILFIQQHLLPSLALLVVLVLLVILEFVKLKRGTKQLSAQQLIQLINHQNAVVVDLRSVDAFTKGHIVGAMSIPLSELQTKYKKIEKLQSQPIVLVCAMGNDCVSAEIVLKKNGITQFTRLAGGMRRWQDEGMPLVKGS